ESVESNVDSHVIVDNLLEDMDSMNEVTNQIEENIENDINILSQIEESRTQMVNQPMEHELDMDVFFSQERIVQDFEDQNALTIGMTDEEW
ncbi:hypothetical protein, partial [Enterococcus sp. C76]